MALLLSFICLSILYTALTSLQNVIRNAGIKKKAALAGCEPAMQWKGYKALAGLDLFLHLRKADFRGGLSQAYRELHDALGPTFEIVTLGSLQIQTADAANIQAICTSNFEDWGVGPLRGGIGKPFIDRGIFTDDGAFWRHSRSLIRPTFNRAEIADLANFERHVQRMLKLIPKDGSTFDLLPISKRLFLDTSTEFLFGRSTECLLPETPFETDEFMKAFDRSLIGLALLLIFGRFRWPFYLDPWWRAAYTKVHEFVDKQIVQILERQKSQAASSEKVKQKSDGERVHSKYVLLEEMAKATQDPYDLRMQIINAFFPARDTAAIAFGDIFFSLARNPNVWRELKIEVAEFGDTPLTYENVRSLPTVRCIVNESLRLHPPASRVARTALKDTILPTGGGVDGKAPLFVAAGTNIEIDLYSLQRDLAVWGDDAAEFRPSRWAAGRTLWEAKWQYEPFLGGIRMCPAQNMVVTQLSYLLVRFAQEFTTLENKDRTEQYVERVTMTVESKNGVKIAFT